MKEKEYNKQKKNWIPIENHKNIFCNEREYNIFLKRLQNLEYVELSANMVKMCSKHK